MVILDVWSRCILIYCEPSRFNEKTSFTYRLVTIGLRRQSRVILILCCHTHAAFVEAAINLALDFYCLFSIRGKESHTIAITAISERMIGCSTPTPLLAAIAPMIKGKTVPPVPPMAMAKPIALT